MQENRKYKTWKHRGRKQRKTAKEKICCSGLVNAVHGIFKTVRKQRGMLYLKFTTTK